MSKFLLSAIFAGIVIVIGLTIRHTQTIEEQNHIEKEKLKDKEPELSEIYHLNILDIDTFPKSNKRIIHVDIEGGYFIVFSILTGREKDDPYIVVKKNNKYIAGMRKIHGKILSYSEMEELSLFCFGKTLNEINQ